MYRLVKFSKTIGCTSTTNDDLPFIIYFNGLIRIIKTEMRIVVVQK